MPYKIQQYVVVGSILVLQLLFEACAFSSTPLISPQQMALVSPKTPEALSRIAKAIHLALVERGWNLESQKEGSIIAVLNVRSHMVKVKLVYNSNEIAAYYLDSVNMDFDGEMIHRKYNTWIKNLFASIRKYLVVV